MACHSFYHLLSFAGSRDSLLCENYAVWLEGWDGMGWDDPTFNGVCFRGMGDGIAPRSEYTHRFEDDPVPRNWRDGGVLSDAPFLPSLSCLLPRVHAPLLLPQAGGELQLA